jgi:hypothetical protein
MAMAEDKLIQIYIVGTQEQATAIHKVLTLANIPVSIAYGQARSAERLARRHARLGGSRRQINTTFAPGFIIQVSDRETLNLLSHEARQHNKPVWVNVLMNGEPTWMLLQDFLESGDVKT